ncbi:hypothetical protein LCGC14_0380930 [marine sediment metagenome]|uniref:Uncharacterized protein n=1 Tax=marine sediment metagenome TaxID=412755 RepID=A0A0F9TKQ4_9ZZZZ
MGRRRSNPNLYHSKRAKTNLTKQLKAQLGFYLKDLELEKKSLKKAQSYIRKGWNNPGLKSMVAQHKRGVIVSEKNIYRMKQRIMLRLRNGEIFNIL